LLTVELVRLAQSPKAVAARPVLSRSWVIGSADRAGEEADEWDGGLGSARATMGAERAPVTVALERLTSSIGGGAGGADCGRDSSLIGGRAGAGSVRDSSLIGGRAGACSGRDAVRRDGSARATGPAGLEARLGVVGGREATLGAGLAGATGLDAALSRGADWVWTVVGER
jgi:hypothetical protein